VPDGRVSSAAANGSSAVIAMRAVTKRFGDLQALGDVDFDLRPGEIHALIGENGAGKTTLMNVLYGVVSRDAGTIEANGKQVDIRTPQDAIELGIGMVHQHFKLVSTLSVVENIVLGQGGHVLVRKRRLAGVAERISELGERYGLRVDPWGKVWHLSVGEQQRVEILRALYRGARVLILDEPTANLTPGEADGLLEKLKAMVRDGASIVFITHHLEEVLGSTDRITVLRAGQNVGTLVPADTSTGELARMMVGRAVSLGGRSRDVAALGVEVAAAADRPAAQAAPTAGSQAVLTVERLRVFSDRGELALDGLELSVAAGEIVGVAGVEGNGQAELEETLFGLRKTAGGRVLLDGVDVTDETPAGLLARGVGLIPSDRYRRGLVGQLTVAENLLCDRIDKAPVGSRLRLRRKAILARGADLIERYSIPASGPAQLAGTLSGGTAQRVVLARTLSRELRLLIAAQPTRGLDVGAMESVWEQLEAARRRGLAVLLISTDLDEVLALADRCLVVYGGRVIAQWPRAQLNRDAIGLAMGGAQAGGRGGDGTDAGLEAVTGGAG
jgi:general nucleoside transport system ATP-binding protein